MKEVRDSEGALVSEREGVLRTRGQLQVRKCKVKDRSESL